MKKTFTLLAVATLITAASFAQHNPRDYNYGDDKDRVTVVNENNRNGYGRDRGTYYFTAREKDMQLFYINREYNKKIESVRHRFFMGRAKKEQLIYSLEMQRNAEIRSVVAKFNDRRNMYDNRDERYGDHRRGRDRW